MAAFEPQLSGMAGEIRAALESEQFDLAGYTEQRVTDLMTNSFSLPLTAPEKMIKFTFVVGGGKLVRAKYNEDMPKWINAALRSIGYETDNSAAETFDSQGTFKQQHDTGKNLIYIHVYPKVTCSAPASTDKEGGGNGAAMDTKSPEYLCIASQLDMFKDIVQKKLPFWRQRKACLKILQDSHAAYEMVEQKMCAGQPLTPADTAIYEMNSGQDAEKIAYLQAEIKALVDAGQLVATEKEDLLKSLAANIAESEAAGQGKKAESIKAKKDALEKLKPIVGRLRHGDEIQKRRMKLLSLQALEDKGRSMSLTIADLQVLGEKGEIEEEVAGYEAASRGWFERDDEFLARCALEEKQAKSRFDEQKAKAAKQKGGGGGGGGGPRGTQTARGHNIYDSAGSWATIGKAKPIQPSGRSSASSGAGKGKAATFANAFGGDDSD